MKTSQHRHLPNTDAILRCCMWCDVRLLVLIAREASCGSRTLKQLTCDDGTTHHAMQVATHVIGALMEAVETARKAAAKPFVPAPDMRAPALLNKAAYPIAAEGIGKVLGAVSIAASIIRVRAAWSWAVVLGPALLRLDLDLC